MRAILRTLMVVGFALFGVAAHATTQSAIPNKFNIPWGNSAGGAYIRLIPQASQIGVTNCAASLTDGFPPLTFTPASSGGCPPFGQDFNGILKQITQWNQWQSMGGPVFWDSAFSTAIGGYPKGAMIQSSILLGRVWMSTVDNNSTNPDDQTGAAANWIAQPGTFSAGTPVPVFSTTVPTTHVPANGLTVGNASSNATNRANADTFWLFSFIWTNCPNTTCQLFNSAGGAIARGGSAVSDWAANDAIATMNMNGGTLMGADSQNGTVSTNLNNVPVVSGSRTVPTSVLGENLHFLTLTETPTGISSNNPAQPITVTSTISNIFSNPITFNVGTNGTFQSAQTFSSVTSTGNNNITVTSTNTGGGAHNNVSRSWIVYWELKL